MGWDDNLQIGFVRGIFIMKKKNEFMLALAALLWGVTFVAQSTGGDKVGAFTFNCIRSFIGVAAIYTAIKFLDKAGYSKKPEKHERKKLIQGGICCGLILFLASNLQQLGMNFGTSAGKAGFLTACYIVFVPVLGIFLKKKCGLNVWIGVVLSLVGLYLLCINGEWKVETGDFLVMLCAICYSAHILIIDHFNPFVDGVRMSCIQFLTVGVLTAVPMIFVEIPALEGGFSQWINSLADLGAWGAIGFAGIFSSGVAYTLQIVGQDGVNPTVASLLMSLESVFSVIAGFLLLGQVLSVKEVLGCICVFAAVMLAQLPAKEGGNVEVPASQE